MFYWNELFPVPPSVLTVVGMAKNAGKTVAMNYLQRMLHREQLPLGLLSVGLDGEQFDALTRLPKPAVEVQPGTLVATAAGVVDKLSQWERLLTTAIHTPVGKIVILRARVRQKVVLAGPSKNHEMRTILRELSVLGAGCVIIDGAFDRQSSADPLVSEQVMLASGATLSRDLKDLVARTKSRVEQLALPACADVYRALAGLDGSKIKVVAYGRAADVAAPTTLLTCEEWSGILAGCDTVLLKGAVGEGLGEALLKAARPPLVIVQDGSKIFIPAELWTRLRLNGVRFEAERAIRLLGVTVNPVVPGGDGLDPGELTAAMGEALFPLPVIDVVREVKYAPG